MVAIHPQSRRWHRTPPVPGVDPGMSQVDTAWWWTQIPSDGWSPEPGHWPAPMQWPFPPMQRPTCGHFLPMQRPQSRCSYLVTSEGRVLPLLQAVPSPVARPVLSTSSLCCGTCAVAKVRRSDFCQYRTPLLKKLRQEQVGRPPTVTIKATRSCLKVWPKIWVYR